MRIQSIMNNIWFTADLHFLHPKIVKVCNRPISVQDHDEWLIERINEKVSKHDTLYILGDVTMSNRENTEEIIKRINGQKHLILGNHDKNLKNSKVFESVSQIKNIKVNKKTKPVDIILCHYPIASWEDKVKGSYHLHGHTHGRFKNSGKSYDVGVDNNNYLPVSLETILGILKK